MGKYLLILLFIPLLSYSQIIDKNGNILKLRNGGFVNTNNKPIPSNPNLGAITVVIAGQSNASGRGLIAEFSEEYQSDNDSVVIFNESNVFATLHAYTNNAFPVIERQNKCGFEMSLGKELLDAGYTKVYIIKYAIGGTRLYEGANYDWNINSLGKSYQNLRAALTTGIGIVDTDTKVFIWHQGEQDATNETYANAYQSNLTDFLTAIEGEYTFNHVYLCRPASTVETYRTTVRTSIENVADARNHTTMVNCDVYNLSIDNVHHTSFGYELLGIYLSELISNL